MINTRENFASFCKTEGMISKCQAQRHCRRPPGAALDQQWLLQAVCHKALAGEWQEESGRGINIRRTFSRPAFPLAKAIADHKTELPLRVKFLLLIVFSEKVKLPASNGHIDKRGKCLDILQPGDIGLLK